MSRENQRSKALGAGFHLISRMGPSRLSLIWTVGRNPVVVAEAPYLEGDDADRALATANLFAVYEAENRRAAARARRPIPTADELDQRAKRAGLFVVHDREAEQQAREQGVAR